MDQPTPPTPSTPPPAPKPRTPAWNFNPWRFAIGLFIILFGLSLLAQQFGWNWIAPEAVWKLWPVFIILIGASMLVKGRMAGTIVGLVMVAIVAGVFLLGSLGSWNAATHTQTISTAREATATAATISVNLGAAKITIRGGATDLASGSYVTSGDDLRITRSLDGTTQRVAFDQSSLRGWMWMHSVKNDLNLQVTNDLPLSFTIDSGAADVNLDLTGVQATNVDLNAGASSVNLTLDDVVAKNETSIDSGAATLNIRVPRDVGLRADIDGGASSKNLPSELKKISDGKYETDGFLTAEKTIDLSVDAGASSITIERY